MGSMYSETEGVCETVHRFRHYTKFIKNVNIFLSKESKDFYLKNLKKRKT